LVCVASQRYGLVRKSKALTVIRVVRLHDQIRMASSERNHPVASRGG
jgi:hypothetical protein